MFDTNIKTVWDLLYLVGYHHNLTIESCNTDTHVVRAVHGKYDNEVELKFTFDESGNLTEFKGSGKAQVKKVNYEYEKIHPESRTADDIRHALDVDSLREFHNTMNPGSVDELKELLALSKQVKQDLELEEVWDSLDYLAIDDNECLEEDLSFTIEQLGDKPIEFEKGASRNALWGFFDKYHSKGVHWLLYGEGK
jgi:hypothetical protein